MNPIQTPQGNFWSFFIKNYRLTYVIILAIVLFGIFSIMTIPKESSPEVDIPVIVVTSMLPGASAVDVELLLTNKIENKIQGIADIDSVTSISSQGFSRVTVSFDVDSDGREKLSDVKERVDRALSELPTDATDPVVQQVSFSDRPILTMGLSGPFEIPQLKEYAEELQNKIEKLSSVSGVNIVGAPERYIEVVLQENSLGQYNLSLDQIINGLASSNSEIPIGSIQTSDTVYTVRLDGRISNVDDVRNTAISNFNGVPIFIRDIATVQDTFARQSTLTRLSAENQEPYPSVTLQVFKLSGQGDILTVVDEIELLIADAQTNIFPEEIEIRIIENDAKLIRNDLSTLLTSGGLTVLIVLSVLIVFLGLKEALLASLVIPLTFLMTFIFLNPLGYTINFLTLFSLILALGILVDASIVVTESMHSNIEKGKTPHDSAILTIQEFQKPLIAGTLTTVFVFLPMLLMSGIMGKFIESIPVTISIVLLSAIFVSLAIITMLGVRVLKTKKQSGEKGVASVRRVIKKIYKWYGLRLESLVQNSKASKKFLWIITGMFFLSLALPIVGLVQLNMFPSGSQDIVYIDVKNPKGTPLATTNSHLLDIENILMEDNRIDSFLVTVGAGSNAGSLEGNMNGHVGSVVINLKDKLKVDSLNFISEYENIFADYTDTEIIVNQLGSGPEAGKPVQVRLIGEDIDLIKTTAYDVENILSQISGVKNVDSGIDEGTGEFLVNINRAQARSFGVSPVQISTLLRTALSGETATVIKNNGADIDVVVRYNIGSVFPEVGNVPQITPNDLSSILIPTNRGNVPLSTFATLELNNSLSSIAHDDGDRVITVSSDVIESASAGEITKELKKRLSEYTLLDGVSYSFGGESEDIAESFTSLGLAMILGIFMIFGLLLWQFNSFRQPLFVLVTIPLSLIGVLFGLAFMNQPLSFPGFIGVVALAGIVVNNAIILIDSINNNRRAGQDIIEAVLESSKSRLQPILLTTLTTVAGMIPLAFSDPSWAPLALSIIFGLMFSTVLTLFVVPILYVKFGEKELSN